MSAPPTWPEIEPPPAPGGAAVPVRPNAGEPGMRGAGCCPERLVGTGCATGDRPDEDGSPPPTPSRVCARRLASAFFRDTTRMLPGRAEGWSSLAMSVRSRLTRAGLDERMSSELPLRPARLGTRRLAA